MHPGKSKLLYIMNKRIVYLFLILTIAACKKKQQVKEPSVYSEKLTYVIAPAGELLRSEELFDETGNCIKEIQFGSRIEDTIKVIKNTYQDSLLMESIIYGAKNQVLQKIGYMYENDALIKQYSIKGNDTLSITYFTYYQNGRLQREVTEYPGNVKNPIITVSNYNKQGDLETIYKQIYEDSTQRVLTRYELNDFRNVYDKNSKKLIQVTATKLFGYYELTDTVFIINYKYDAAGNRILQKYKKNSTQGEADSIRFTYSENNLLVSQIRYTTKGKSTLSRVVADSVFYTYDDKNRLAAERNPLGLGFRYAYTEK